jgi:hypothetical protein
MASQQECRQHSSKSVGYYAEYAVPTLRQSWKSSLFEIYESKHRVYGMDLSENRRPVDKSRMSPSYLPSYVQLDR